MTRSDVPRAGPWNPRTCATATADPRYGSSPAPSIIRPQRGSRAMSTIGANAQWMPTALASRAATVWPRSIVSGSQEAAMPIDREPLQAVDFRRVGDEQERADLTTP